MKTWVLFFIFFWVFSAKANQQIICDLALISPHTHDKSLSDTLQQLKEFAKKIEINFSDKNLISEIEGELFQTIKNQLEDNNTIFKEISENNLLIVPSEKGTKLNQLAYQLQMNVPGAKLIYSPHLLLNDFNPIEAGKSPDLIKDFYLTSLEAVSDNLSESLISQIESYDKYHLNKLNQISDSQEKLKIAQMFHDILPYHRKNKNLSAEEIRDLTEDFLSQIANILRKNNQSFENTGEIIIIKPYASDVPETVIDPQIIFYDYTQKNKWVSKLFSRSIEENKIYFTLEDILTDDFGQGRLYIESYSFAQSQYLLSKINIKKAKEMNELMPELNFKPYSNSQSIVDKFESPVTKIIDKLYDFLGQAKFKLAISSDEPMIKRLNFSEAKNLSLAKKIKTLIETTSTNEIREFKFANTQKYNFQQAYNIFVSFLVMLGDYPLYKAQINETIIKLFNFEMLMNFQTLNPKAELEKYLDFLEPIYHEVMGVTNERFQELREISISMIERSQLFTKARDNKIIAGAIGVLSHKAQEKLQIEELYKIKLPRIQIDGKDLPLLEVGRYGKQHGEYEFFNIFKTIVFSYMNKKPRPSHIYIGVDVNRAKIFTRYGFKEYPIEVTDHDDLYKSRRPIVMVAKFEEVLEKFLTISD
ncbi:MAG: hypothetical protein H6621_01285 [Halobacteriovoraceae bacterium]|nr:hypothetical protein [Halobacteriovoraceae bacterium]MCB9093676.1 hypothetical protein [Halobacteriovoraceae bacterium]